MRAEDKPETQYFDRLFECEIKDIVRSCDEYYSKLLMRQVVIQGFFKMLGIKEEYRISCGNLGEKQSLVKFWMHSLLVIISPVIPHLCQHIWQNHFMRMLKEDEKKDYPSHIVDCTYPEIDPKTID